MYLTVYYVLSRVTESDKPLNCAFQRKIGKNLACVLTRSERNLGTFSSSGYEPCLIDICPIYQTWKLLKEKS